GKNAFFDFNLNKNYLILNGFSYPDSMGMVNQFISQRPGKNTLSYFVPNNTASFFHYSISDPILWKSTFQNNKLSKEKNVDVSAFLKLTTGEFGMVNLENSVGFENEKLILAKIKNAEALVKFISELNQSASEPSDSLYAEQFTDYQINEIITKEFPSTVFNPDWTGFDRTYFSMVNDVLVMGNSIKTVKDFILDIENENTWGKSVRINNFLQNSIEESNLTLYFNVNRLWEDILVDLHPSWKEIFENNASTLRKFEIASIQFSGFEDKFYTNITLAFNNEKKILKPKNLFNVERKTILPADVVIKPKVVRNHTDRSLEVFVQDENNMIHLVDKRGTILWSEVIPEKITSSVTQIDYFKNGKLQYMFATENNIYLIDRNGNHVSPFPIQIQNYKIDKFSIIDYDKSKNYRLFLTDFSGNMYIYSKEGKLLDQWETAKNNGRQITPPTHIRIRGKDYILILQEKGAFSVLNRQGKLVNGFPYQFVKTPNPEYNIKEGNDLSNTLFTFVSNDGTLSEIYLNGKEKEVKQLYRISKDTRFKIVDETLGKGFVITQQEEGILKTLNPSGIELFSTKYLSPNPLNAQYYNFGSDRRLLVVNDIFQEYSYVFDFKGEMVNNSPFESSYEVGMVYFESSNSFNIYSAHENNVYIYSF
ncbi:MAG: hypothetical protein OEY34_06570, partial [Cyclobacteriaceae bacterium]|nr:hypothetical protein [Cyclobacteriaceae bacterium]